MLSPILITVYNRKDHLKKSLTALKANELAKDSILYVASDAAYRKEDEEIIKEIRKFLKTIDGFKEVRLIIREKNIGSYKSVKYAIEEVLKEHKKIIFLEDDIVVSKNFLNFMNESLEVYESNKNIFSICAYVPPNLEIKEMNYDVYMWNYYCPWGMATWKEKWEKLDLDLNEYDNFFKKKKEVIKFFKGANHALTILMEDRKKRMIAMDARIDWNMFQKGWVSIYPIKSLSKNIGVDGSGEHSGNNKIYSEQILEDFIPKVDKNINFSKNIYRKRQKYHEFNLLERMYMYLKIFEINYIFDKLYITKIAKKIRSFLKEVYE